VNVYPFVEAEKAQQRNVKRACELLEVSRAAYYAARGGQPSDRDRQDAELTVRITAEHTRSKGRYGAPRICAELRGQGRRHSRKRVARLMRQAGLRGRAAKRRKKTTIPDPAAAAPADQVAWQRISTGAGAHGPREFDWARIPVRTGWRRGRGHWLLARRSLHDPEEIAYYACFGPRRSSWRAWYAHITLSMLALAWLAASRAQAVKRGSAPAARA
jgi:transposase InsO family protein